MTANTVYEVFLALSPEEREKFIVLVKGQEEKPKYGLTHPLKSYSFLWQHFHYYFESIKSSRCSPKSSIRQKCFCSYVSYHHEQAVFIRLYSYGSYFNRWILNHAIIECLPC